MRPKAGETWLDKQGLRPVRVLRIEPHTRGETVSYSTEKKVRGEVRRVVRTTPMTAFRARFVFVRR